jgi:RHS repeat-associated protein
VGAHSDTKFLYDRWNAVAELNGSNVKQRTYIWGLDLSGSRHGAGGVGGLLKVTDHTTTPATHHYAGYDGNGNVLALNSGTTGASTARYEYGPFGETIRVTGTMAEKNPFRFSTKFADNESGLVYYGYRYYSSINGTWLGRDPIEEAGGINLFGVAGNNPMNRIDLLGLSTTELHHVIPEWLVRYTAFGARSQGFCIRLTTDFHRLTTGFNLEAQLSQIRVQFQSGTINQSQAYNRVLLVHLRNLPAIIRNNRVAVGISGGSAIVFRGSMQAALAQVGYFSATEAALGATGIGAIAVGGYYLAGKWLEWGEYNNNNLVGQSEIDLYNSQVGIASRAAQQDGSAILSVATRLATCNGNEGSECARKFRSALNRNYYSIQTMGVDQFGISTKQARDAVSEQLFADYVQCLKAAGCCLRICK